ncbi:hypothetical protein Goshw_009103 [Gossypium schwendimanii]|uniref:RNase H type-1 domain-containing protein n=1 Tax=Gossypium schwendimanii TaxID=34291 RepID=A0A7J9L2U5_GOSSC|nr:hypothetical protein [Gossypium schwendimanii]
MCPRCGTGPETDLHACRDCPGFFGKDAKQVRISIITISVIWNSRNKIIHEGIYQSIQTLLIFVLGYAREMDSLLVERKCTEGDALLVWKPPIDPWVRVNFDADFYGHLRALSTATVVRDSEGFLLGSAFFWQDHVPCALAVEALARVHATRFADDLRFQHVELEGDSAVVISKLKNAATKKSRSLTCWLEKVFSGSMMCAGWRKGHRRSRRWSIEKGGEGLSTADSAMFVKAVE